MRRRERRSRELDVILWSGYTRFATVRGLTTVLIRPFSPPSNSAQLEARKYKKRHISAYGTTGGGRFGGQAGRLSGSFRGGRGAEEEAPGVGVDMAEADP